MEKEVNCGAGRCKELKYKDRKELRRKIDIC